MVMGRTILQMDEPEHRSIRTLVASSFRSKMLERWEEDLVARVVNELIDTFIDEGRTDLVRSVTFNFPVQVIARILGLPREDYPKFQRWALELTSVAANWERGIAASAALRDYFADVMAERRAAPGDDLISDLVRAEVDGQAPERRGDLLLPAAAAAGRCGDDLPGLGQHAPRAPRGPGPVRRALRRSHALPPGLRGGRALGAAGHGHPAPGHPRRGAGRRRHRGGRRHRAADRRGEPRRAQVPGPRPLRHVPRAAPARRLRLRRPRLPGHASRPDGVPHRHQHPVRPPRALHVGPGRRAAAHRGNGVPVAALPAGGLRPRGGSFGRMGGRANPLQDAAAIVGIGQTEFAKHIDRPEGQLAAEAVVAALRDAGIAPSEVDGLSSFTMETTDEVTLAKTIGAGDITYFSQVGFGGGAGCATIGHAAMAIATGQADVVVAWRSRKRGDRAARPWAAAPVAPADPGAVDAALRPAAPGRRGGHAGPPLHVRVRGRPRGDWPRWPWPYGPTPTGTRRR